MKRAMFAEMAIAGLICLAVAGCAPPAAEQAGPPPAPAVVDGWTRPPTIESVRRVSTGLIFSGQSEPGARVVLRSDTGPAHAASADSRGHFEIRMALPAADLMLHPETQIGQDAVPSPDRLLVVAGPRGPVAILRPGGATRRLDAAPALDAIDSDGRMRLVSGRSSPTGAPVELNAGGQAGRVMPDAAGRWSLVLTPSAGPDEIRVGGRTFTWPGEGVGEGPLRVERAGAGWRVLWSGPGGGRQTTWLPDAF